MKSPVIKRFVSYGCLRLLTLIVPVVAQAGLPFVPFPDNVRVVVVGENIVVNGLPVMAYEFHTQASIEQTQAFYRNTWSKRGKGDSGETYYLETSMGPWKVISRLESGHNITVQLMDDGIKGVRALVGVSPLPQYLRKGKKNSIVYHVPRLGLAKVISLVRSRDNDKITETYWMDSGDSVDAVLSKYKAYYEDHGYQVSSKRAVKNYSSIAHAGFVEANNKREIIRIESVDMDEKTRIIAIRSAL